MPIADYSGFSFDPGHSNLAMHSHGSGEDTKGTGTGQRNPTESELQSEVKKIRVDLDALTTKVDKQAVLLANQVIRTANIASSIENDAKETHKQHSQSNIQTLW